MKSNEVYGITDKEFDSLQENVSYNVAHHNVVQDVNDEACYEQIII